MTAHGKGRPAGNETASKNPIIQSQSNGSFAPLTWALKNAPLVMTSAGKLDQAAMLVLIHLATWANANSLKAWPSVASVAERSGLTDETVRRAMRRLADAGHIAESGVTEQGVTVWRLDTELKRTESDVTPAEQARAKRREAAAARNREYRARQRDALRQRHAEQVDGPRDALGRRHVTHSDSVRDGVEQRHVTHWDAEERPALERPLKNQEMNDQPSGGATPSARGQNTAEENTSNGAPKSDSDSASYSISPPGAVQSEDRQDGDELTAPPVSLPGAGCDRCSSVPARVRGRDGARLCQTCDPWTWKVGGSGTTAPAAPENASQGLSEPAEGAQGSGAGLLVPLGAQSLPEQRNASPQGEPLDQLRAAVATRNAHACGRPAFLLLRTTAPHKRVRESFLSLLYQRAFSGKVEALKELQRLGLPEPSAVLEASA